MQIKPSRAISTLPERWWKVCAETGRELTGVGVGVQLFFFFSGLLFFRCGDAVLTHCSIPLAGPFRTTSEITIVSPVSGLGLSLPPEMAIPKPTRGSCEGGGRGREQEREREHTFHKPRSRSHGSWLRRPGRVTTNIPYRRTLDCAKGNQGYSPAELAVISQGLFVKAIHQFLPSVPLLTKQKQKTRFPIKPCSCVPGRTR